MWWLTTVGKAVWVPSKEEFKLLPEHSKQAHRLFMAGKTSLLLRGTA